MDSPDCSVAVVGGGPAGATAALTLARLGYQVVLVEGSRYEEPRVGETLLPSVRPLLERIGLWDAFASLGSIVSFGNQSAWGGPELWAHPFIFSPYGNGWHVDRRRFDSMLAEAAVTAGVTFLPGIEVISCAPVRADSWVLGLRSDGRSAGEIRARAVIDATGRRAALARGLGARRRVHDHLVGVAAVFRRTARAGEYTLVEATAEGWWYSAPTPEDRMMVMFMTDADLCRAGGFNAPEVWVSALARTEHTRDRLACHELVWRPRVWSAVSHRLERTGYVECWLAVGDAAVGVDPLSASGISRALQTGVAAGHALAGWLERGPDAAERYERWLDGEFAEYWQQRSAYYALETRWPQAPFWQRRLTDSGGTHAIRDQGTGDRLVHRRRPRRRAGRSLGQGLRPR